MKKLIKIFLLGLITLVLFAGIARPFTAWANTGKSMNSSGLPTFDGEIQQDQLPTPTPAVTQNQSAGRGEGLIFISSIIVLIILSGLIFSSRRRK